MQLNQLADNKGARKSRTRLGRGIGSGKGKTCARGVKGQKSRSGVAIKGFEGGQQAIYRRLPKRGFTNIFRTTYEVVNLGDLQAAIDAKRLNASKTVDRKALVEAGLVRDSKNGVKLLGNGELKSKITLEVNKSAKSAQEKLEKAGGKLSIIEAKPAKKAEKDA